MLGPIFVLKRRPGRLGRKVVAEVWMYPDSSRILELSTKCHRRRSSGGGRDRALLAKRGIDVSGEQQTKTKTALRIFAKQLANA